LLSWREVLQGQKTELWTAGFMQSRFSASIFSPFISLGKKKKKKEKEEKRKKKSKLGHTNIQSKPGSLGPSLSQGVATTLNPH